MRPALESLMKSILARLAPTISASNQERCGLDAGKLRHE
jgi:hypothetical protein